MRDSHPANICEFVTNQTFAWVKQAWVKATTTEAAIKGFVEAGLFPLNPSCVLESVKLQPSQEIEAEYKQPEPAGIETSESSNWQENRVADGLDYIENVELIKQVSEPVIHFTDKPASSVSEQGISTLLHHLCLLL